MRNFLEKYLYSIMCGIFGCLGFYCLIYLISILNFHEVSKHPYGYPLSMHINKPWQADLIYIIMKPLEWLFLITLYLFDVNPENRIAVQYIGSNKII